MEGMLAALFGWEGPLTVVDLGYLASPDARERAEQLMAAGLGKKNFQILIHGRVVARIPPTRVKRMRAQFPGIVDVVGAGYCGATHTWLTEDSASFARCQETLGIKTKAKV
ncbi:MAG TPA: hypothetical protein VNA25_17180 [Phycisphaerae bacterium]|nr:hypothetical protein [Phycisphaerae bacterium]